MKKYLLLIVLILGGISENSHALSVIDHSNLAQNIISAQESLIQTAQQLKQLQTEILQYKRMLLDALNPAQWGWGDIQNTLDQLKNTMKSLEDACGTAGNVEAYLNSFGTYDKYSSAPHYGSKNPTPLYEGDLAGGQLQKKSADELLLLIKEQQEALDTYSEKLEELQGISENAEGQQQAIQATNQFASLQIELLSQIHTLLLAQNTMLAAKVETDNNREAQQRMGTAIRMGESPMGQREAAQGGSSYRPF